MLSSKSIVGSIIKAFKVSLLDRYHPGSTLHFKPGTFSEHNVRFLDNESSSLDPAFVVAVVEGLKKSNKYSRSLYQAGRC